MRDVYNWGAYSTRIRCGSLLLDWYCVVAAGNRGEDDEPEERDEGDKGDPPLRRHYTEGEALHRTPDSPVLDEEILPGVCSVATQTLAERIIESDGLDKVGGWEAKKGRQDKLIHEDLGGNGQKPGALSEPDREEMVEDEVLHTALVQPAIEEKCTGPPPHEG